MRRALAGLLAARGRAELAADALDRVVFTDDGSTIYVHVLAKASWPHRRPGRAYPLAFADKSMLRTLRDYRALLWEAWQLLHDEIEGICQWFDGR